MGDVPGFLGGEKWLWERCKTNECVDISLERIDSRYNYAMCSDREGAIQCYVSVCSSALVTTGGRSSYWRSLTTAVARPGSCLMTIVSVTAVESLDVRQVVSGIAGSFIGARPKSLCSMCSVSHGMLHLGLRVPSIRGVGHGVLLLAAYDGRTKSSVVTSTVEHLRMTTWPRRL
jgi:hypothetical protein